MRRCLLVLAVLGALIGAAGLGHASGTGGALRRWPVVSSGMEPTLHCRKGQPFGCQGRVADIALSRPLLIGEPRRGDIVVLAEPVNPALLKCGLASPLIKRVVGLPGETVNEDRAGKISIDGKALAEPYVRSADRRQDTLNFGHTWRVPNGRYFLMGDARDHSCDSRQWGSVTRGSITDKVVAIQRGTKTIRLP